ncbi:MAG: universal stress protein [Chloroflexi bacterium]|nr:universal stress protein [Chloroflexota bacterium]
MRDVLVPLDGTQISEAGLRWAAGAAYRSGSHLRLITVVDDAADESKMSADRARDYLHERVRSLRSDGIEADWEVIAGAAAETILRESENADLTVMTSGTTRWFVSDVLDRVLQSMSSPLIVVRGDRGQLKGAVNLESILVPLSETNYSAAILPAVADVARAVRAKLILFQNVELTSKEHGSHGLPPVVSRALKLQLEQAEQYIDSCAEELRAQGLEVDTLISSGDHVAEIVKAARTVGAGLIAMATRGRDRLESRISGSVANAVLEASTLACLVVRTSQNGAGISGFRVASAIESAEASASTADEPL